MSTYTQALDELTEYIGTAMGIPATRDPSVVLGLVAAGGCVFVGFPTQVNRLMEGPNLEVPVQLLAKAPPNLASMDWLLEHMDKLIETCGSRQVVTGPASFGDTTFPAVTVTAQITVTTT